METDLGRMFVRRAAGAALIAAAAMIGLWALPAGAAGKAESIVGDWPEPSRRMALAMIDKHGQPNRVGADAVTWFGLYRGRRTVVHRAFDAAGMVEQVVLYRVPAEKAEAVTLFDGRLKVDREAAELSARTESVRTSFLVLNLAHEVASGFRTVPAAREFRDRQMRLAQAGKSSRYRDGLIFEQPTATRPGVSVLPGGVSAP
jgi:hypothetical protein